MNDFSSLQMNSYLNGDNIRFFERISKTYKSEKWEPILHPLLSAWYKSAQQLGDVDMSVRILAEMIAKGVGMYLYPHQSSG